MTFFSNFIGFIMVTAVVVLPFVSPIKACYKGEMSVRKQTIFILSLFILTFAGFSLLFGPLTFSPQVVSGNGNPAWFVIPELVALFAVLACFLWISASQLFQHRKTVSVSFVLFTAIVLIFLCIIGEVRFVQDLVVALGGGPTEHESVIYRYGWLNIYTNKLYFNGYTFAAGVFFSISIGGIVALVKRNTKSGP
ncbi:MAG TPA: hypothetical protein VFK44_05105 [Bacillales bacterium]|nr:hypothetical protein [Bacillales bacterium]